ncbi:MAG: hypothetical protein P8188_01945 [Gemmatimonadota bacterium]
MGLTTAVSASVTAARAPSRITTAPEPDVRQAPVAEGTVPVDGEADGSRTAELGLRKEFVFGLHLPDRNSARLERRVMDTGAPDGTEGAFLGFVPRCASGWGSPAVRQRCRIPSPGTGLPSSGHAPHDSPGPGEVRVAPGSTAPPRRGRILVLFGAFPPTTMTNRMTAHDG